MKDSLILWLVINISSMIKIQQLKKDISLLCVHGFCSCTPHITSTQTVRKGKTQEADGQDFTGNLLNAAKDWKKKRQYQKVEFFFSVVIQIKPLNWSKSIISQPLREAEVRRWRWVSHLAFSFKKRQSLLSTHMKHPLPLLQFFPYLSLLCESRLAAFSQIIICPWYAVTYSLMWLAINIFVILNHRLLGTGERSHTLLLPNVQNKVTTFKTFHIFMILSYFLAFPRCGHQILLGSIMTMTLIPCTEAWSQIHKYFAKHCTHRYIRDTDTPADSFY